MFAAIVIIVMLAISTIHAIVIASTTTVVGAVIGYTFRTKIASEVSKLALSTIISKLENLATEDVNKIREEVSSLAASLRKHL